jgi:hypothetical protein
MRNEKGFTYPLTLTILILFLLVFSFRVEQLLTERKLSHESAVILQEEYYFQSSFRKIETIMLTGTIPTAGLFTFLKGNMGYQADSPIGTVQKVNFTLKMHSGEIMRGRGFFDLSSKKMIKWIETF